jgi:hypothetical protein
MKNKKIIVAGLGRHGKDTLCEIIQGKYPFTSSSWVAAERVMFPIMQYPSVLECFNDRHNYRSFWFDKITEFNTPDKARLGKIIFSENDVYCGIRNAEELAALRAHYGFDLLVIWVDAMERMGITEDSSSITITKQMADIVLYNNGTEEEFRQKIVRLFF